MSEAISTRSLEVIGAEIRALTASMLGNVIEIGRRMVEAKELLPHGGFGAWIKENTGYSHSTANNFMKLFLEYGNPQGSLFGAEVNSQTFGKLSYTKALALLALPSEEEREAFVETHDVEAMSTRELQQAIKERDEAITQMKAAQAREKDIKGDLLLAEARIETVHQEAREEAQRLTAEKKDLEKELEELRSRPVDVAIQEPDPAVIQERAEAIAQEAIAKETKMAQAEITAAKKAAQAERKTWAEEKKAMEDKIQVQKDKLDELFREQAKVADAKTSEIYQEEIDRLKKQLAMSDADTTTAKVLFSAWQEAYRKLSEAVDAAPAETGDKLRAAIKAQAKAWAGEAA